MNWRMLNPINWSRKQWLALIVAFVVAWYGQIWLSKFNLPPSHQFNGQIERVLGPTTFLVKGVHVPDANPEQADYLNMEFAEVRLNKDTKYSGGLTNAGGLSQSVWISVKTADNSSGQNIVTASEISKATEYSVGGKVTAVTGEVITLSTIRVIAGDSGNYTALESKQVIVSTNIPVLRLSLKNGTAKLIPTTMSAIKVGSAISVFTNIPPDAVSAITPVRIQISQ